MRTGTTILHDILNQDAANRAPLTWELMFPSPPPEASIGNDDPRVAACQATIPSGDERSMLFKAMHPMGATLSQECVVMMGESMCTALFHNQFRVPSYQDWVDTEADWSAVYAFHRRQLQHLDVRRPADAVDYRRSNLHTAAVCFPCSARSSSIGMWQRIA